MAKLRFHYDDNQIQTRVRALDARLKTAINAMVDYHSLRGMAHMKTNAPWTDRTGAARTGLHTVAENFGDTHVITFAHAVNYGIWLEVKFSGRDAIIMPSVRKTGDELMASLRGIMGQL